MIAAMLAGVLLAQALEKPALNEKAGTLSFGATTLKPEIYAQLKGAIEYVLVNKGGKAYESVFEAAVDPVAVYDGLKALGAQPGQAAREEDGKTLAPQGGKLRIFVEWKNGDTLQRQPIGAFVLDTTTGKAMAPVDWVFTGSKKGFIPELEDTGLLVLASKNLVALHQSDPTVLLTNPVASKDGSRWKVNKDVLPKEGTPVTIVIEAVR